METPINLSHIPYTLDTSIPRIRSSKSLAAIQKERKRVESDIVSLSNRVSVLQKEEEKIWKNIHIAKTIAKDAYGNEYGNIKPLSTERSFERRPRYEESPRTLESSRMGDSSLSLRKQRDASIQGIRNVIQRIKNDEMLEIKRQSVVLRIQKHDIEEEMRQEKHKKMIDVRRQEMLAVIKKKAFFEKKMQKIKQDQEDRLNEEEQYKISKELEALELERKEMAAIQRLQEARKYQKQFYRNMDPIATEPCEAQVNEFYQQIPQLKGNNKVIIQKRSNSVHRVASRRPSASEQNLAVAAIIYEKPNSKRGQIEALMRYQS